MNSFMDSFPPREPHGVTQNSHRGCSAAIWWMTWSPEKAPAPPALVWEDAVVGEQTYEPHVKWSIFTGQDPRGQEGPNPSDMSHSEALEVLGASDSPSCPSAHIPVTRQPLSLLTQHHRHPFLPGAEHSAGSPGRRSHGQHLVLLLLSQGQWWGAGMGKGHSQALAKVRGSNTHSQTLKQSSQNHLSPTRPYKAEGCTMTTM